VTYYSTRGQNAVGLVHTARQIYLNNSASAWPTAPGVVAAVASALEHLPVHPGRGESSGANVAAECRQRLANLLGAHAPERVAFASSATHALNLAILGLGLKRGDHVITSVTEHNSVLRPLARLADGIGIRVTVVGLDEHGDLDADAFGTALQESPRLVVLNHASNVTGRVNAVSALFHQAKAAGAVTLLDASQSLGHWPVNAPELGADLVAFTGHKGLRGPVGTGGLYVAEHLELEPVLVGGTGVRSDLRLHPSEMPTRLEAGTPNVPALAGLNAALLWLETEGPAFLEQEKRLALGLWEGLRTIDGVCLFDDAPGAARLGLVSFRVDGWAVEETGYVLDQSYGIACRTGLHCAPLLHAAIGSAPTGTVRFSPSGATTEEDIAQTLGAVRRLAA
jgi:cysteine desulfurase / selenocysteine lyase